MEDYTGAHAENEDQYPGQKPQGLDFGISNTLFVLIRLFYICVDLNFIQVHVHCKNIMFSRFFYDFFKGDQMRILP